MNTGDHDRGNLRDMEGEKEGASADLALDLEVDVGAAAFAARARRLLVLLPAGRRHLLGPSRAPDEAGVGLICSSVAANERGESGDRG